ncbi:MAG: tetratricopeptide repeat protein [Candidatus Eisenbacteria bacterium]
MEKAIEIKRRAQRCIQNNDLDGALNEYEKLVQSEEADPYNYVLLADLLYKKGDPGQAADRYLSAVGSYEKASLYKNAIAVCKKMLRLSLSQARVLKSLANLHALDGFAGESALYYTQYAEQMVRSNLPEEATKALRSAFDVCQDNVRVLEQLAEAYLIVGDNSQAAAAMLEAANHYRARNQGTDALRCSERATQLDAQAVASEPARSVPGDPSLAVASTHRAVVEVEVEPGADSRVEGLETGGTRFSAPRLEERPTPEDETRVYEIPVEAASEPSGFESPMDDAPDMGVYEITVDDEPDASVYEITVDDEPDASVYEIAEEAEAMLSSQPLADLDEDSPSAPGLAFPSDVPLASPSVGAGSTEEANLVRVESLLAEAQEQFRSGNRELASRTLAEAGQAYEQLGRLDNAATIYRSLGRGAQATQEVMILWLGNCQARANAHEAAQVACELGDRALNDGNEIAAREWFEQATAFDSENEVASRRLQRMAEASASSSAGGISEVPVADRPTAASASPGSSESGEVGRVEVAVGRAEAVTFDLSGLLAEFQRGVEAQLSGDAQSHYDLGMTYREMGLIEQAVDSFRIAEQDSRLAARALEMTGRCYIEQDRFAEAVIEFERALAVPDLDIAGAAELRFHLAQAHESAGDRASALREFEAVAEVLSGYEDVDARIASLRGATGQA